MLHCNPRRDGLVILIPGCCLAALREPLGAPLLLAKRSCRPGCLLIAFREVGLAKPSCQDPGCCLAPSWPNRHPNDVWNRVQLRCSQSLSQSKDKYQSFPKATREIYIWPNCINRQRCLHKTLGSRQHILQTNPGIIWHEAGEHIISPFLSGTLNINKA